VILGVFMISVEGDSEKICLSLHLTGPEVVGLIKHLSLNLKDKKYIIKHKSVTAGETYLEKDRYFDEANIKPNEDSYPIKVSGSINERYYVLGKEDRQILEFICKPSSLLKDGTSRSFWEMDITLNKEKELRDLIQKSVFDYVSTMQLKSLRG